MTFQPGHTKTGGRKRGVTNKRTERYQAEVTKSGLKPVDYLLTVMRDKRQPLPIRLDAAKAAAPYTSPRLAVIDSTVRAEVSVSSLTADELRAQARALIAEAFRERPLLIEHEPRVVAGRDIAADVSAQANGEQQDESEG